MRSPSAGPFTALLALAALLALVPSPATAGTPPAPPGRLVTLAEAESLALARHPMIAGAEAALARDREMPAVEGSLADPILEIESMDQPTGTLSLGRAMRREYTLRQMAMDGRKRSAMRKAAAAMAEATAAGTREAALAVQRETRGAYHMLAMAREEAALVRGLAGLLRALREAAQARFSAGSAEQSELLRIDLELSRTENGLLASRRDEESARAMLAALTGLSGEPPFAVRIDPAPRPVTAPPERIIELARARDPELARAGGMTRAAEERLRLARLGRRPDWMYALTYADARGGMAGDSWSAMAGLTLPVHRRRIDADMRAKSADASAARAMGAAREVDLAGRIGGALAAFRERLALLERTRGVLIPKAERAYEAALAEYRNSKVDLERVIMSAMAVYDLRMDLLRTRIDALNARADLERLAGGPLE